MKVYFQGHLRRKYKSSVQEELQVSRHSSTYPIQSRVYYIIYDMFVLKHFGIINRVFMILAEVLSSSSK